MSISTNKNWHFSKHQTHRLNVSSRCPHSVGKNSFCTLIICESTRKLDCRPFDCSWGFFLAKPHAHLHLSINATKSIPFTKQMIIGHTDFAKAYSRRFIYLAIFLLITGKNIFKKTTATGNQFENPPSWRSPPILTLTYNNERITSGLCIKIRFIISSRRTNCPQSGAI